MALGDPIYGDTTLLDVLLFVLFISLAGIVAKVLYYIFRRYLDRKVTKKSSKGIARFFEYAVFFIALYISFVWFLGLNLNTLFVSLGIISLAVALAAQQFLENVLAGLVISVTKPYELEDWVDVGGTPVTKLARVRDISMMFTELRDLDGKTLTLPNSYMLGSKVVNYTKAGFVAFDITVPLKQGSDLALVYKVVYHEADIDENILPNLKGEEKKAMTHILARPYVQAIFGEHPDMKMFDPQVNVTKLEESRITLDVKIWVKDPQRQDEIISKFLETLNRRFKEEGIQLVDL